MYFRCPKWRTVVRIDAERAPGVTRPSHPTHPTHPTQPAGNPPPRTTTHHPPPPPTTEGPVTNWAEVSTAGCCWSETLVRC